MRTIVIYTSDNGKEFGTAQEAIDEDLRSGLEGLISRNKNSISKTLGDKLTFEEYNILVDLIVNLLFNNRDDLNYIMYTWKFYYQNNEED